MPYCPYIIRLYNMHKNHTSKPAFIVVNHIYIQKSEYRFMNYNERL